MLFSTKFLLSVKLQFPENRNFYSQILKVGAIKIMYLVGT